MWHGPLTWQLVSADVPPTQVAVGKQNWTLLSGALAGGGGFARGRGDGCRSRSRRDIRRRDRRRLSLSGRRGLGGLAFGGGPRRGGDRCPRWLGFGGSRLGPRKGRRVGSRGRGRGFAGGRRGRDRLPGFGCRRGRRRSLGRFRGRGYRHPAPGRLGRGRGGRIGVPGRDRPWWGRGLDRRRHGRERLRGARRGLVGRGRRSRRLFLPRRWNVWRGGGWGGRFPGACGRLRRPRGAKRRPLRARWGGGGG